MVVVVASALWTVAVFRWRALGQAACFVVVGVCAVVPQVESQKETCSVNLHSLESGNVVVLPPVMTGKSRVRRDVETSQQQQQNTEIPVFLAPFFV